MTSAIVKTPNWTYYQPPGLNTIADTALGYQWLQNMRPGASQFTAGYLQGAGLQPNASGLSGFSRYLGKGKIPLIDPLSKGARIGGILGRATPYMPAVGNVLEGDLVGAGLSAGGAMAGAAIGSVIPVIGTGAGAKIGGMVGEPLGKGVARLAGGAVGIDPRNPLSGPDWSLGPIALTPYAKTKKQTKRAVELAKLQMPLYNEIADRQSRRDQALQSLADAGSIISNVYSNNPYR